MEEYEIKQQPDLEKITVFIQSNMDWMTGATCGAETVYPSPTPEFTSGL